MAALFGIAISLIGILVGQAFLSRKNAALPVVISVVIFIPALMSFESRIDKSSQLHSTTTSVIINQRPDKVWQEVIAFSQIDEPTEWFFQAGIAYPTHAEIVGTGTGAIRYCNFSTGRFVEPITEWKDAELLQFTVL